MSILDDLLKSVSYKAVYLYDTRSAYIWRNGECSYHRDLSIEQVNRLLELTQHANRRFMVQGVAFGFST